MADVVDEAVWNSKATFGFHVVRQCTMRRLIVCGSPQVWHSVGSSLRMSYPWDILNNIILYYMMINKNIKAKIILP